MAAAITDFLKSATLLYQQVLHVHDTTASDTVGDDLNDGFIRDFDSLATRLAQSVDTDHDEEFRSHQGTEHSLARACLKVSRDVLLRLRRTPGLGTVSFGFTWTVHDSDVFGTLLLDLGSQWKQLQPLQDDTDSFIAMLSRLKPADEPRAISNENEELASASAGVRAPAVTSAGILTDFILESLSFKSMKNREEEVADAHSNTFDWLFRHSSSDKQNGLRDQFTTWLQSDKLGSIYWVTGKPGAGKSTLMRYIAEHKSTDQLLKEWAAESRLVKAVFYFWTSGSEEQRSQTGLLRYLLYQLLSLDNDATAEAFPKLWQKLSTMNTKERIRFNVEWNVAELMDGFRRFVKHALKSTKICLFVDGLDEFDGDHQAIIHFFKNLVESNTTGRIKLCLSSRPWPVFEKAFQYSVPNLKLQELTYSDMTQYVQDSFLMNIKLGGVITSDEKAMDSLISLIVRKAEGVFLWTRLVVRKILEVYGVKPDLIQIENFISGLPSDLDELFNLFLFENQTKNQQQDSAHLFQLVYAQETIASFIKDESANSLSIWELTFALSSQTDDMIWDGAREVSSDEVLARCQETLNKVTSGSTGLLEVYSKSSRGDMFKSQQSRKTQTVRQEARRLAKSRVTYLHRTVRDYLISNPYVWKRLTINSSDHFDPHIRLLQSYVLRLKHSIDPIEHHRRLYEWYPDIVLSLTHARHITNDPGNIQTSLIDGIDQLISWYWESHSGDVYDHWARNCFGSYEQRKGNKIAFTHPFLALCTKFGLQRYVLDTLDDLAGGTKATLPQDHDEETAIIIEETPLLSYALEFLTSRQKTIMPLSSHSFVLQLLNSPHLDHPTLGKLIGCPNMIYNSPLMQKQDTTPWLMVLSLLRDTKRRGWIEPFDIDPEGTERWTSIVKALTKEGSADLNAFIKWNGFDAECYARDVLVGERQLGSVDDWWIRGFGSIYSEKL